MNGELLIPITLFASIFGIMYVHLTTRNKERMALIEKGATADLFNKQDGDGKKWLKIGIMAIGVGLGIILENILVTANLLKEDIAFPAMIFMSAGAGLVVSYYITRPKN